jgi:rubrerythrin
MDGSTATQFSLKIPQREDTQMEATPRGPNRTGTALNPKDLDLMLDAVQDLSPPGPVNTLRMDVERQRYIAEAESVGSVPPPQSAPPKSGAKRAGTRAKSPAADASMTILFDKLGERIAFERTGTRLYSALITKYLALTNAGEPELPLVEEILDSDDGDTVNAEASTGESALQTLTRIRAEELGHFRMLCDLVLEMGGDPTAQTPCADVTATASMGLLQVLTDPRTTLAQCLDTILTAELTDNAGWDLLSELAEAAGQKQLLQPFAEALATEQEHLAIVQSWLKTLMTQGAGSGAV